MSEQLSIIEHAKANIIAYKQAQEEKERIRQEKFNEYLRIETERINEFIEFIDTIIVPSIIENSSNGLYDCSNKYLLKNIDQFEFKLDDYRKLYEAFNLIIRNKLEGFKTSVYIDCENQYTLNVIISWREACRMS